MENDIEELEVLEIKNELVPLLSSPEKIDNINYIRLLLEKLFEIAQLNTQDIIISKVKENIPDIEQSILQRKSTAFTDVYFKICSRIKEIEFAQKTLQTLLISIPEHQGGNARKLKFPDNQDLQKLEQEIINFLDTLDK